MLCGLVFRRSRYYEDSVKCSLSLFITKAADQELYIDKFLRHVFFRGKKKRLVQFGFMLPCSRRRKIY